MTGATGEIIAVVLESTVKRSFVRASDWPGWARPGKTEALALDALTAYATRYASVAGLARQSFGPRRYEVVERVAGDSGTDYGIPAIVTDDDRRPIGGTEAGRRADLVMAAWDTFDRVAAEAPAELRKGPRGGGRDRDKMIGHVVGADHGYARQLGHPGAEPDPSDRAAIEAERAAVLEILRQPSDGTPIAGRRWTTRYAAVRIAWHALDHAWEMEDRTDRG